MAVFGEQAISILSLLIVRTSSEVWLLWGYDKLYLLFFNPSKF